MLQDKHTALMCAAVGGHTEVVQLLLSRQNLDINMRDKVNVSIIAQLYYYIAIIHCYNIVLDASTFVEPLEPFIKLTRMYIHVLLYLLGHPWLDLF